MLLFLFRNCGNSLNRELSENCELVIWSHEDLYKKMYKILFI